MLERILDHLHNYFVVSGGVHAGEYVINSSALDVDFLQSGQYYRIVGSVFNDGVHKYGDIDEHLIDERFVGEIWAMAPSSPLWESRTPFPRILRHGARSTQSRDTPRKLSEAIPTASGQSAILGYLWGGRASSVAV